MEIDGPSHAGNGWQYGPYKGYGDLAVCVNQMPWRSYCIQPPCGSLNPTNTYTYQIWTMLYKKLIEVFPKGAIYHLGGDEVKILNKKLMHISIYNVSLNRTKLKISPHQL